MDGPGNTDDDEHARRANARDRAAIMLQMMQRGEAEARSICNRLLQDEPEVDILRQLQLRVTISNGQEAEAIWNLIADNFNYAFLPRINTAAERDEIFGHGWPRFAEWVRGVRDTYVIGSATRLYADWMQNEMIARARRFSANTSSDDQRPRPPPQ